LGGESGGSQLKDSLGKSWWHPISKASWAESVVQVVESLPSKNKALRSNPSATKNPKKTNQNKPDMIVHVCNPSYSGGGGRRVIAQGQSRKSKQQTLSENQTKIKRNSQALVAHACNPSYSRSIEDCSSKPALG
jgi:hypothetical protein